VKLAQKLIYVFADWSLTQEPELVGCLFASQSRGKEIFSFGFDQSFIHKHPALNLDPNLLNVVGPQYSAQGHANFGLFLDAAPDRWGRVLMRRREVKRALDEKRASRTLMESDFLLGVFDGHRLGGLRFKAELTGPFLDNDYELASPPSAKLSDLEYASLQLERADVEQDKDYGY
jgi:serine/threonine-protein kinase HipA